MSGSAVFSPDGRYRYLLTRTLEQDDRQLAEFERSLTWIMLNPSTADGTKDDATIRRVTSYSRAWGATRFAVVNLFAFRATDPRDLPHDTYEACGPAWSVWLERAVVEADAIVVAWGARVRMRRPDWSRLYEILNAAKRPVLCLSFTKTGEPRHPLYLPTGTQLEPFRDRHLVDVSPATSRATT